MFGVPAIHFARFLNEANNLFHKKGPAWTRQQTKFRKERRIYPAGHSITRARCRMNAAFHRGVQFAPE
jgi:hypothetical protein